MSGQTKYLIDGLNRLDKLLDAKRLLKSKILMQYIERKMITAVIVAKREPTKENLDHAYATHVKKFGGELLMYRHFANQQMETMVNKAISHMKFHEQAINMAKELEFEPNLNKLRSRDPAVNERMLEIGRMIKDVRSAISVADKGQLVKASEKKLNDFVSASEVSDASEGLIESILLAAKNVVTGEPSGISSPFRLKLKPSTMEAGGI